MKVTFRILQGALADIHRDLSLHHTHAAERVGFLTCGVADLANGGLLLLADRWQPVADDDYLVDDHVGASIGPTAFRRVFALAWREHCAILHVHRHEHYGRPAFSSIDLRSMRDFVPGFFNACPVRPHGALVLSLDEGAGAIWLGKEVESIPVEHFEVVGSPLRSWRVA